MTFFTSDQLTVQLEEFSGKTSIELLNALAGIYSQDPFGEEWLEGGFDPDLFIEWLRQRYPQVVEFAGKMWKHPARNEFIVANILLINAIASKNSIGVREFALFLIFIIKCWESDGRK